jgi:hypothetical protein
MAPAGPERASATPLAKVSSFRKCRRFGCTVTACSADDDMSSVVSELEKLPEETRRVLDAKIELTRREMRELNGRHAARCTN